MNNLIEWSAQNYFDVLYEFGYDAHTKGIHKGFWLIVLIFKLISRLIHVLTGGHIDLLLADYVLLLRKKR